MNQKGTQVAISGKVENDDTIKRSIVEVIVHQKGKHWRYRLTDLDLWVLVQEEKS